MKKLKYLVLFISVVGIAIDSLNAQVSNTGTTSANFLKIGVDARSLGMAGAVVGTRGRAMATYWNPAIIGTVKNLELGLMHNQYILDMSHEFAIMASPVGSTFNFAFALSYFNAGSITETERTGPGEFNELGTLNASDLALYVSMSQRIEDDFFLGLSVKPIFQTIGNYSGQSVALDIGALYFKNNIGLGIAIRNVGLGIALNKDAFPLPIVFSTGFSYNLKDIFCLSADFEKPMDNKVTPKLGVEISPFNLISLRSGYNFGPIKDDLGQSAGLAVGAGLNVRNLAVDYAYNPMGFFGNSHRISLTYLFAERKPPELSVNVDPDQVTINDKEVAKLCRFKVDLKYCEEADNWKLTIKDPGSKIIKVWTGENHPPKQIVWEIKADSENGIQSGKYGYVFTVNGCSKDDPLRASGSILIENQIVETKQLLEAAPSSTADYQKKIFTISDILFDLNSASIREDNKSQLNQVTEFLAAYPNSRVIISGHTDDRASNAYNMQLSIARANSIMNYLIRETNVDPDQITTQGFGETQPLVPNTSQENRQKNRRVEILIYYQKKSAGEETDGTAGRNESYPEQAVNAQEVGKLTDLVRYAALKHDLYQRYRKKNLTEIAREDAEKAEQQARQKAVELGFKLVKAQVKNEKSLYEVVSKLDGIGSTNSWRRFFSAWEGQLVDLTELHPGQVIFILVKTN